MSFKNKKKHLSVLEDSSPECSYAMPSNKKHISLLAVNFGTSVEEFE
jgi:hypothetical protein